MPGVGGATLTRDRGFALSASGLLGVRGMWGAAAHPSAAAATPASPRVPTSTLSACGPLCDSSRALSTQLRPPFLPPFP